MRYIVDAENRLKLMGRFITLLLFASLLGWGEAGYSHTFENFEQKKANENILLPFCVEKKLCGYMQPSGQIIVPAELETARDFSSNGFAIIQQEGKWGIIDRNGRLAIRPEYDGLGDVSNGLAAFKQNGKWGYLDTNHNIIVPAQFDMADRFTDNHRALVKLDGKYGFIDRRRHAGYLSSIR